MEGDQAGAPTGATPSKGTGKAAVVAARIAYLVVFFWNVLCAVLFIVAPSSYVAAYELSGVSGEIAIQGIGIAFLMWNATYQVFIVRPRNHLCLGGIVLAQQAIGLVGELCLLATLPSGHYLLASSITRFVVFDAAGFVIMGAALAWLARTVAPKGSRSNKPRAFSEG